MEKNKTLNWRRLQSTTLTTHQLLPGLSAFSGWRCLATPSLTLLQTGRDVLHAEHTDTRSLLLMTFY
ncbi:hypothetical protein E2C01_067523 [Portunus trituberculatus]|uniref:Uncharacterized protein n=1 Tax=Portunus trituberculatus TaxID=210409 RepID=A0A5B7HPJ4_PORTR|nr:hypothetical protein [Portunus trituberculatus]